MKRAAKPLVIAKIAANHKIKPVAWGPRKGPWDRKVKKADGGDVDKPPFDPSQPFQPVDTKPPFDPSKPFEAVGDKPAPSWSDAVTDIPHEIGAEASSALDKIKALGNRGEQGPLEGLMTTGKAALAVPQLIASPLTGAARSLIGHPMAQAEHAVGSVINPEAAAKDDPAKMYETAKGDVDTAMSAMAAKRVPPPVNPPVIPKPSTIGDFDVPLSVGQATGDFTANAEEKAALRGGRGEPAQRVAQSFQDLQNEAVERARSDVGKGMDRFGQNIVTDPQAAGEMVGESVQNAVQNAKSGAHDLYNKAFSLPGEMHAGAFEGIAQKIKGELTLGDNPVIIDDKTTPIANNALKDIENNISRLKVQNNADPFGQPNPENIVGINLKGVDQTRKRLVQFVRDAKTYPPTADTRATQAVLNAFDNHIENSIAKGLFSGDDRALDALKDARGAYANYRKTFTAQGSGDDVGRAMQKIIGTGLDGTQATPTEIANYLYGSANVGQKGLSVRLAQRLKGVLGEQSPEWDGVRQGLWSRLTQSTEGRTDWGPQKMSERISEFLNGSGKPLAEGMFAPAERDLMRRYSELLKKLVPPPGSVNYSNNLPMLNRIADAADKHVGAIIGGHVGGFPGMAAGYAGGKLANNLSKRASARRIAQLMPTIQQSVNRWQRAQAVAARGKVPTTPALTAAATNLAKSLTGIGFDYLPTLRALQGPVPAGAQNEQPNPPRMGNQ